MENTVKLYKYRNRDVVIGYYTWYSLAERDIDPYSQDDLGAADYILPADVEIGTDTEGYIGLYRGDDRLKIDNHEPSGLPQLIGYCLYDAIRPVLRKA